MSAREDLRTALGHHHDAMVDMRGEAAAGIRVAQAAERLLAELDTADPGNPGAVEAVARAMYDANRSPYLNEDQHDEGWASAAPDYRALARAALTALREFVEEK